MEGLAFTASTRVLPHLECVKEYRLMPGYTDVLPGASNPNSKAQSDKGATDSFWD